MSKETQIDVAFVKVMEMRGNNDLSALHGKWEYWLDFETESLAVFAWIIPFTFQKTFVWAPKKLVSKLVYSAFAV